MRINCLLGISGVTSKLGPDNDIFNGPPSRHMSLGLGNTVCFIK